MKCEYRTLSTDRHDWLEELNELAGEGWLVTTVQLHHHGDLLLFREVSAVEFRVVKPKEPYWLPMSSAPRDGAEVLIADVDSVVIAEWIDVGPYMRCWRYGAEDRWGYVPDERALGWMPVPPTPTAKVTGGKP